MEVIENRALKLHLRNPARVTSVIPKSAVLGTKDGISEVMVHWSLEEAQVLKNLGIKNVPSPIIAKYKWPGMYPPFAHQVRTAGFMTLHRRAFCFNEQGCVDADTEYLTPTGWKRIADYTGGVVGQYDPDSTCVTFVEPTEYVKLPCTDMIRIKTKYGLDQMLSPEHRVLLHDGKSTKGKREVVSAQELLRRHNQHHAGIKQPVGGTRSGTSGIAFSAAAIPTSFRVAPETILALTDLQLRVQVAVIADGYYPSQKSTRCVVRLKKERKINRLRDLLSAAKIPYKYKVSTAPTAIGFHIFTFYAPWRAKEFDARFWSASNAQLDVIASEVCLWDGCSIRGTRFFSNSKDSADFVQYVMASRGYTTARIHEDAHRENINYSVQIRPARHLFLRGSTATMAPVHSTDGFKYCFMVPTTFLLFRRNGCIFASGNTGKTLSMIWAADYLMTLGLVKRVLVICPVSVMQAAWVNDLFHGVMHRTVSVAHHTDKNKRKKILSVPTDFTIINFDGVAIVSKELLAAKFDMIIIDEANAVKTATTDRWKHINKLVGPKTWLWMATGTPASQAPTDAYGLLKMMHPTTAPRSFTLFRDMVMTKVTNFKWVPKMNAIETVNRLLQPAIRFTKEQCLDLPDIVYSVRDVPLSPAQHKLYEQLRKNQAALAAGQIITAVNAAAGLNKLLQVSSGAVYTDDRLTVELDITPRYNVLKEIIDSTSRKVLVFVPYKNTIEVLLEKLAKDGYTTDTIHGGIPANKRGAIIKKFETQFDPKVMVMQPAATAHGTTLVAADTTVWWGPIMSYEIYTQANARFHRQGQKFKCNVIKLQGSKAEIVRYKALEVCADTNQSLLELYSEVLTV